MGFLKKLIKREQRKKSGKSSKSSSSKDDMHKKAGRTFIDWLTHKKGSRKKLKDWVKAKLYTQMEAKAKGGSGKVSKSKLKKLVKGKKKTKKLKKKIEKR